MHFEDIWELAEKKAKLEQVGVSQRVEALRIVLDRDWNESPNKWIGELIYHICSITGDLNVNSAVALAHNIGLAERKIADEKIPPPPNPDSDRHPDAGGPDAGGPDTSDSTRRGPRGEAPGGEAPGGEAPTTGEAASQGPDPSPPPRVSE